MSAVADTSWHVASFSLVALLMHYRSLHACQRRTDTCNKYIFSLYVFPPLVTLERFDVEKFLPLHDTCRKRKRKFRLLSRKSFVKDLGKATLPSTSSRSTKKQRANTFLRTFLPTPSSFPCVATAEGGGHRWQENERATVAASSALCK